MEAYVGNLAQEIRQDRVTEIFAEGGTVSRVCSWDDHHRSSQCY